MGIFIQKKKYILTRTWKLHQFLKRSERIFECLDPLTEGLLILLSFLKFTPSLSLILSGIGACFSVTKNISIFTKWGLETFNKNKYEDQRKNEEWLTKKEYKRKKEVVQSAVNNERQGLLKKIFVPNDQREQKLINKYYKKEYRCACFRKYIKKPIECSDLVGDLLSTAVLVTLFASFLGGFAFPPIWLLTFKIIAIAAAIVVVTKVASIISEKFLMWRKCKALEKVEQFHENYMKNYIKTKQNQNSLLSQTIVNKGLLLEQQPKNKGNIKKGLKTIARNFEKSIDVWCSLFNRKATIISNEIVIEKCTSNIPLNIVL